MKRIGILGGGQLALMLAQSLQTSGAEVAVFDPDSDAPAGRVTRHFFNAAWDDSRVLSQFFAVCDRVTYEFENVACEPLRPFEAETPILPSLQVLATTQDRIAEKVFLRDAGLPHAHFAPLLTEDDRERLSLLLPPLVVKSATGGYDGKGQVRVHAIRDIAPSDVPRIVEEAIDIALEVSCLVARSPSEQEILFPLFENVHTDHILDLTLVPARLPSAVADKVRTLALQAARELKVHGLLAVEFFLTRTRPFHSRTVEVDGWHILINEFAPRPHNSGHVTRNACTVSQYDALARMLLDVPLTSPRMRSDGFFCMGNLLGDVWLAQGRDDLDLSALRGYPDVIEVVQYGKKKAVSKRKMGHFVVWAHKAETAMERARSFRAVLGTRVGTP